MMSVIASYIGLYGVLQLYNYVAQTNERLYAALQRFSRTQPNKEGKGLGGS